MTTDPDLAAYVADQLSELGEIGLRRMFGVYCFYINEKPVGFLCGEQILVKTNVKMREEHPELPTVLLFEGAKNPMWLIENPDDVDAIRRYYKIAYESLPPPKPKRPRGCPKKPKARRRGDGEGSPLNDPEVMGEAEPPKEVKKRKHK